MNTKVNAPYNFAKYLSSLYIKQGETCTHTRLKDVELGIKGGAYLIPDSELEEFYKKYYNHAFVEGKQEYLTEIQLHDAGPILVDFDFKYDFSVEERQHTKDHVVDMVLLYMNTLKTFLKIDAVVNIPVFVFEKTTVNCKTDMTKDGIHMIIGIHMERKQQMYLRSQVLLELPKVWGDLPVKNSWEDIIDNSITTGKTGWQLYNSRKPGCKCYLLKYHFILKFNKSLEWECSEMNASEFNFEQDFKLLTARYRGHQSFQLLEEYKQKIEEMFKTKSIVLPTAASRSASQVGHMSQQETDFNEEECIAVIARLNPERAREYSEWKNGFLAIMNNREMSSGMKERLVHQFSALCPDKYKDDEVAKAIDAWRESMYRDDGLHFATVRMWANQDSPIIPKGVCLLEIKTDEGNTPSPAILLDRTRLSESPMADQYTLAQMAEIMGVELSKFIKYSCDAWFVFDSKTCLWTKTKDFPVYMVARFWENVCYYNISKITSAITMTDDDDQRKILIGNIRYLRNHIGEFSSPSANAFIKQCFKSILIDSSFIEKLDMQLGKLVFKDGILDMKTRIFRKGIFYNDFVTNTMDLIYNDYIKVPKNDIDKTRTILLEINCNNLAHFNYQMETLGFSLLGYAYLEDVFFAMVGKTASNGKSTVFETLTAKMPLYCEKLNTKTFEEDNRDTHKMIGACRGKRIVWVNELNKKKLQNTELIKDFADGTFIKNKVLYGTEEKIPIVSKLFFVGNGEPKFVTDKGMERRYNYVNFAAKFHEPEEFSKLQIVVPNKDFKKDIQKKEYLKTDNGFYAMLHLILEGTARYLEKGFSIPPEWVEMKRQACEKNDKYYDFISSAIVRSTGECIHKSQFEEVWVENRFDEEYGKFNWADFQLNMESKGFVYDRIKSKRIDGHVKKGCFLDVAFKVEEVD